MSTVAFLASIVDKRIASVAANAAIREFQNLKTELPKTVVEAHQRAVKEEFDTTGKLHPEIGLKEADLPTTQVAEITDMDDGRVHTEESVQKSAAEAISASAVKANYLANLEEKKIQGLIGLLVETQIKKIETKLQNFEQLEKCKESECEHLETMREQLIQEKQSFHIEQIKHHEAKQQAMKLEHQKLQQQKNHLLQLQNSVKANENKEVKDGPGVLRTGPGAMDIDEDTNQSAVSMGILKINF